MYSGVRQGVHCLSTKVAALHPLQCKQRQSPTLYIGTSPCYNNESFYLLYLLHLLPLWKIWPEDFLLGRLNMLVWECWFLYSWRNLKWSPPVLLIRGVLLELLHPMNVMMWYPVKGSPLVKSMQCVTAVQKSAEECFLLMLSWGFYVQGPVKATDHGPSWSVQLRASRNNHHRNNRVAAKWELRRHKNQLPSSVTFLYHRRNSAQAGWTSLWIDMLNGNFHVSWCQQPWK